MAVTVPKRLLYKHFIGFFNPKGHQFFHFEFKLVLKWLKCGKVEWQYMRSIKKQKLFVVSGSGPGAVVWLYSGT